MANVLKGRLIVRNLLNLQCHRCCAPLLVTCNDPRLLYNCPTVRFYSKDVEQKPTLFQRFKQMYRDYWYVLVPVHLVTSAAWFGSFYYAAKSGVDIASLLESWHVSEKIVNPLRDSSMGYIAVSYALYKISTPARYAVTLGGTTISINYLKKWGCIKPVPSKERLKEMYEEKKENFLETIHETKEELKDKKEHIIDDFDKGIKKIGEKIKTKEQVIVKKEEKKDKR